jgi:hypothetical protein
MVPAITPTPSTPVHFDYRKAATQASLSAEQLQSLIRLFESDYPHDLMLRELHVLRACNAIVRGTTTAASVLAASQPAAA